MKHDRQWLDDLLADLRVHRGDTTSVEMKRASGGMPEDIGTTICTFANLPGGGDIILGVHEAGGFSFPGVSDAAETEAALTSIARQTVHPSPYLETRTIDYDGVQIVIAHVTALSPPGPTGAPLRTRLPPPG